MGRRYDDAKVAEIPEILGRYPLARMALEEIREHLDAPGFTEQGLSNLLHGRGLKRPSGYVMPWGDYIARQYDLLGTVEEVAKHCALSESRVRNELKALGKLKTEARPELEPPVGQGLKGLSTLVRVKDKDDDSKGPVLQWVKTDRAKEAALEAFSEAVDLACARIQSHDPIKPPVVKMADLMCVIPLGDPHIGMLAWGRETGEPWDLALAEKTFKAAIDYVVRIAPPAETCLLINLGDYFHANDQRNVTPGHGHQLDVDSRHGRVLDVGLEIMRYMVERCLRKFSRVTLDNVRGNHDPEAYEILPRYISAWFRDEPRLTVINEPGLYHFHEFGENLVATHHGHRRRKARDLEAVMARRKPEAWGRTQARNRRWYVGHIHTDTSEFTGGCTVETHATLAAPDAYAAGGGWDSDRNIKLDILHKKHGLTARHVVGVDQLMSEAE